LAGRYLAAISGGGCGDVEDPTLSPVYIVAPVASRGLDMRNLHASERAPASTSTNNNCSSLPIAPRTPTKIEKRFASAALHRAAYASPHQQLKMQPSPSGATAATATTVDAFSSATSAASPMSRHAGFSRSPRSANMARPSPSSSNSQSPSSFFSIFPSAKSALRISNIRFKQQHAASPVNAKVATPRWREPREGSSSGPVDIDTSTSTRAQHLQQPTNISNNLELGSGNTTALVRTSPTSLLSSNKLQPMSSPKSQKEQTETAHSSAASAVMSDLSAFEGAPTEVRTNRSVDRRYVMDWRSDYAGSKNHTAGSQNSHRRSRSLTGYEEQEMAEEKKQDSDTASPNPHSSRHHQTSHAAATTQIPPGTSDEDMLLYGPIPLERSTTRRTSNRGKFSQPSYSAAAVTRQSPYAQHRVAAPTGSGRVQQQQESSSQQYQLSPHQRSPQSQLQTIQIQHKTSPRLNRLLSGNYNGQEGYVRRKGVPLDTKSLLSTSTNGSSSGVSPTTHLNPGLQGIQAILPVQGTTTKTAPAGGCHWWDAEHVTIKPRRSTVGGSQQQQRQEPQKQPTKAKAVVAYPDSPPPYLKPEILVQDHEPSETQKKHGREPVKNQTIRVTAPTSDNHLSTAKEPSNKDKKDESFYSHTSDAGVIGLFDESDDDVVGPKPLSVLFDDSDDDVFGPKPLNVPRLAPSKHESQKKKKKKKKSDELTAQPQKELPKPAAMPPRVQLKPRKNPDTSEFGADGVDPTSRSNVSETSAWTPVPMSEDGFIFSAEHQAPLLPLFAQDRFDTCGPGDEVFSSQSNQGSAVTLLSTKLEEKLVKGEMVSLQQRLGNQQNATQHESNRGDATKPLDVLATAEKNRLQGHRPCSSPEIWRRGHDDEENNLASPDPIFCAQRSQMTSSVTTMQSSIEHFDSGNTQSECQSPTKAAQDAQEIRTSPLRSKIQGRPAPNKRWPTVRTTFDRKSDGEMKEPSTKRTGMEKQTHPNVPASFPSNQGQPQGVPSRSISGPSVAIARYRHLEEPSNLEDNDASSKQALTGVDADAEKSVTSTGSLPRRAKSEQCHGHARKKMSPLRGSFRAAFAAFEKANAGREAQALFPDHGNGGEVGKRKPFVTSRLTMVLHTHLSMDENGTLDTSQRADTISVDVQSIRSNFEGVAPLDDDGDDDDTASVKSLREVFESAAADPQETVVSKMKAIFETKKAPVAKEFETENADLRDAWKKFEAAGPRQRRQFLNKDKEHRHRSVASLSVAERATIFGAQGQTCETQHALDVIDPTAKHKSEQRVDVKPKTSVLMTKPASGSFPSLNSFSDSGVKSSLGPTGQEPADFLEKEIAWKSKKSKVPENSGLRGGTTAMAGPPGIKKATRLPIDGDSLLSEHLLEVSIPSDNQVFTPASIDDCPKHRPEANQRTEATNSAASSGEIISPPRLRIQSDPREEDRHSRSSYIPRGFSPTVNGHIGYHHAADKETASASEEGEFSDGVTLDLSIAEVSQLTDPTVIQSKTCDESTLGDMSLGEKTVEIDLMDCEAKRSEASSSQQTEAAAPLIARALERLSDDLSLESRNQVVRMWEKSSLLADNKHSTSPTEEESKTSEIVEPNIWDLRHIEAFPTMRFASPEAFFGFEDESAQEWQPFEKGSMWPDDPFLSQANTKDDDRMARVGFLGGGQSRDPDGFHLDAQSKASVNVAEATTDQTKKKDGAMFTKDNHDSVGGAPEPYLPRQSGNEDESKSTEKVNSPPRMYDVRSRVYTQARQHAKSLLASRSPSVAPKRIEVEKPCSTPPRTSPHQSPNPSPRSPAAAKTTRFTTAVIGAGLSTIPVNPVLRTKLDLSRPATPSDRSRTPSSQPGTPTQCAFTPTFSDLLRADGDASTATPKVSHRRGDVQSRLPKPSAQILDAFPNHSKHQRSNRMYPPMVGGSNHDDFFVSRETTGEHFDPSDVLSSTSALDPETFFSSEKLPSSAFDPKNLFPSENLPSAVFEPNNFFTSDMKPVPAFNSIDVPPTSPPDDKFLAVTNSKKNKSPHASPGRHNGSPFARTHPTSNEYARQRKHMAEANVRSARAYQPRDHRAHFVVPKRNAYSKVNHDQGGRLAAVVSQHAALIARLKVLKAARLSRSVGAVDPSTHGHALGGGASDLSKTSIGRAIASVYKSRRANNGTPKYTPCNPASPSSVAAFEPAFDPFDGDDCANNGNPKYTPCNPASPSSVAAFETTFDPFDGDDYSESTWSSTHFGGRAFTATLEVE
jgi:hypothetical protein